MKKKLQIWTIGHSNHSIDTFLELLDEHRIQVLVDVRSFPTSKTEHFKREEMKRWLPEHGIEYVWLGKELGGYRQGGYKRYMRTKLFREGIKQFLEIAKGQAYMHYVYGSETEILPQKIHFGLLGETMCESDTHT